VGAALSPGPGLARATAVLASAGVLVLAAAASLVPGLLAADCAAVSDATAPPSATAAETIPAAYLTLYRQAGAAYTVPWPLLAAIGAIESDHGRSHAPGVHSGVNAFGCCAGPMQFNLRDGPPSTWQTYRSDGDRDGDMDPYDATDAIASAARYLHALLEHAGGDVAAAIYGYNHSSAYVVDVLDRARAYSGRSEAAPALRRAARARRVWKTQRRRTWTTPNDAKRHAPTRCCRRGRWPAADPPRRSTPACSTTRSGCCAPTGCA
jgi:membrane-bound lytic murein transglycosylase B